jgi:hypothetical protein
MHSCKNDQQTPGPLLLSPLANEEKNGLIRSVRISISRSVSTMIDEKEKIVKPPRSDIHSLLRRREFSLPKQ